MLPATAQEIDLGRWTVTQEFVDTYLEAVENQSVIYQEAKVAPPLALAARVLGLLLKKLSLPPGAVHTSQEVYSQRAIEVGQEVWGSARASRPLHRGQWQFISTAFVLSNKEGKTFLKGKTTVMVPAREIA